MRLSTISGVRAKPATRLVATRVTYPSFACITWIMR
jgi:hypothetical protein